MKYRGWTELGRDEIVLEGDRAWWHQVGDTGEDGLPNSTTRLWPVEMAHGDVQLGQDTVEQVEFLGNTARLRVFRRLDDFPDVDADDTPACPEGAKVPWQCSTCTTPAVLTQNDRPVAGFVGSLVGGSWGPGESIYDQPEWGALDDPEAGAVAFDQGKPDLTLVPVALMEAAARGLEYGCKKYRRNNFKKRPGLSYVRHGASLLRHVMAWAGGTDIDAESGIHHLDLAAARLAMLLYEVKRNALDGTGGEDDR